MTAHAYARVSTRDQHTDNQRLEIANAGYQIEDENFYAETISGKCPTAQRPQFQAMLGRIRKGETLVVTKLDRLGRDAVDVLSTVRLLAEKTIKVKVLQIGDVDLTSPAGKMHLTVLSAVAEMERDLLVERTQAGLARAKADGKTLGRKKKTTEEQREQIKARAQAGESPSVLAREFNVSRATVIGIRDGVKKPKKGAVAA